MNNVIATITLIDGSTLNVIFIDRKTELMGSTPVGLFLKVKTDTAQLIELPYTSILKIEYKQL